MSTRIYGRLLRKWSGRGIATDRTRQLSCTFEVAQLAAGQVRAMCESDDDLDPGGWLSQRISLRGEAETGETIEVEGGLVSSEQRRSGERGLILTLDLVCQTATVRTLRENGTSHRYGITNLDLFAPLRLKLDSYEVTIRPVESAEKLLREAKVTRSAAVTAEATVTADINARAALDAAMDRVCLLLSLSVGHGVSWVYRELVDESGQLVEAFHVSAITKRTGGLELVPQDLTQTFVQACYSTFQEADEQWDLKKAIHCFTDAKAEGDYLETRALKIVVVIELVRARFLERTTGEWVLPEKKYQAGLKPLRKLLTAALEVVFSDEPPARLRRLLDNTLGLNRPTFRSTVSAMQKALGMRLDENDKSFFVSLRNELVHRVRFLPGSTSPWEQFALLTTVVSKFLLATLGWRGEVYDWRSSSSGSGPKRVKLDQGEANQPTPEVM